MQKPALEKKSSSNVASEAAEQLLSPQLRAGEAFGRRGSSGCFEGPAPPPDTPPTGGSGPRTLSAQQRSSLGSSNSSDSSALTDGDSALAGVSRPYDLAPAE